MLCLCRRHLMLGATGTLVAGTSTSRAAGELPRYCSMNGGALTSTQLLSSSGDRRLDNALIAELRNVMNVMPVNPGFKFIRDPEPNAFAMPDTIVNGTRGTVLLGLNLIRQEMAEAEYGGVSVAGISAHECGHIFQYFSDYGKELAGSNSMHIELHADYLAGFYMGRRRSFSADRVAVFARSIHSKGDYSYNDKDHHGTPDQREDAMMAGYAAAAQGLGFEPAAKRGASFVRRIQ